MLFNVTVYCDSNMTVLWLYVVTAYCCMLSLCVGTGHLYCSCNCMLGLCCVCLDTVLCVWECVLWLYVGTVLCVGGLCTVAVCWDCVYVLGLRKCVLWLYIGILLCVSGVCIVVVHWDCVVCWDCGSVYCGCTLGLCCLC